MYFETEKELAVTSEPVLLFKFHAPFNSVQGISLLHLDFWMFFRSFLAGETFQLKMKLTIVRFEASSPLSGIKWRDP